MRVDVADGSEADIGPQMFDVRFSPNTEHALGQQLVIE
jgi:hypothetical protein